MIAWSIEAAHASGCFEEVVVSTDDSKIAVVAERLGATIPFIRPVSIADDYTDADTVVAHAAGWFIQQGFNLDSVCCIYATAPFIRPSDIRNGLKQLQKSGCDYAFTVTSYSFPIQRALQIDSQRQLKMFYPEHLNSRSQDLEATYHDAGQFYWGRTQAWLDGKPYLLGNSAPIQLPGYRVQDIDTPDDWKRAEVMFKAIRSSNL